MCTLVKFLGTLWQIRIRSPSDLFCLKIFLQLLARKSLISCWNSKLKSPEVHFSEIPYSFISLCPLFYPYTDMSTFSFQRFFFKSPKIKFTYLKITFKRFLCRKPCQKNLNLSILLLKCFEIREGAAKIYDRIFSLWWNSSCAIYFFLFSIKNRVCKKQLVYLSIFMKCFDFNFLK